MNGSNTKDAFPFSAAIAACAKVGQWQVSLRILQQMTSHQVPFWGCPHGANISKAQKLPLDHGEKVDQCQ